MTDNEKLSYTTSSNSVYGSFKLPVYTWKCELFGVSGAYCLMVEEHKVPNWFWRKMQYLCFGNKWIKL